MKLKVVFDLNTQHREILKRYIGKSKGIKPQEYKEALYELFNQKLLKLVEED